MRIVISLAVLFGHYVIAVPDSFLKDWFPYMQMHGVDATLKLAGAMKINAFFIIAGFYTQLMLEEKYADLRQSKGNVQVSLLFYYARFIRLLPAFYVVMLLALAAIFTAHSFDLPLEGSEDMLQKHFFANFFLLNERIFWWPPQDVRQVFTVFYIPSMWALPIEVMFVILAPIFLFSVAGRVVFFVISAGLASYCYTHGGIVRIFLAAELVYFSLGSMTYLFYRRYLKPRSVQAWQTILAYGLVALVIAYIFMVGWIDQKIGPWGTYFGFITLFTAFLPFIAAFSRHLPLDRFIGDMAYSIYLVHRLLIRFVLSLGFAYPLLYVLPFSALFAFAMTIFIDKPLAAYRERLLNTIRVRSQTRRK